jgi:hypothetical protein
VVPLKSVSVTCHLSAVVGVENSLCQDSLKVAGLASSKQHTSGVNYAGANLFSAKSCP